METQTALGLIARHALTTLGGYLAGKGLLGNDPASLQNFIGAGMVIAGVGWSAWQKYGVAFVNAEVARAKGLHATFLAALFAPAVLLATIASPLVVHAADLPRPLAVASAPLNMTGWSGFYAGASQTATGTGVSLGNFGSLTAGGSALGIDAGWETYNGTTLFGGECGVGYDIMTTNGPASLPDHLMWHCGPKFGGNLASMFGFSANANSNMVAQFFANSVPYIAPELCGHHGMTGYCTTVGAESVIPNTRLTAFAKYVNGQFGNQSPNIGQAASTDNSVVIGVAYHF